MNTPANILVGTTALGTVWVRVEGKGSYQNSPVLKDFFKSMIQEKHTDFVVDLRNCPVMDSTFMGTLTAIGLGLRDLGQGKLRLVNLNERNLELLSSLGLDQLLTIVPNEALATAGPSEEKALDSGRADKLTEKQTMLEAHEACVAADQANAAIFKDVIEYLKQNPHRPH